MLDPNRDLQPALTVSPPRRSRRNLALLFSAAVHGAAVVILCWRPAIFVKPQLIAHGEGGTATPVSISLYLPQSMRAEPPIHPTVSIPAPAQKTQKRKPHKRSNALEKDTQTESAEAGSQSGTAFYGSSEGDEVMPAIPLPGSFPDPKVSRWEAPGGLQGDVIVEITINDQGAVVDTKLLQGMGHGIDEKVIAALRDWHFQPATRNGIAIPSKQNYYYHFPS